MNKYIARICEIVLAEEKTIITIVLLLLLCVALFAVTLSFPPTDADDLILLSSVANTQNPLSYFVGDWGLNDRYRPLHSVSLWLVYQVFGVSAFPNQLINLALHFVNVCLLFRIIQRVQTDRIIIFLFASLLLVSIYTLSPASWVSDRPTLLVAVFLLMLVDHILPRDNTVSTIRISYVAILSILAVMSKESGLVVPLFALFAGTNLKISTQSRIKIVIVPLVIVLSYMLLLFYIFGPGASSPGESGYIFGVIHYTSWSILPKYLKIVALVENVMKNLLAPILPIFSLEGGILLRSLIKRVPMWLPTALLFELSISRNLTRPQKYALIIVLLNSLIHYALFRYRTQYVSQIAFCLFIASSPFLTKHGQEEGNLSRKMVFKMLATTLLIFSIIWASRVLNGGLLYKYDQLSRYNLEAVAGVDKTVIEQVIDKYQR